MLTLATAMYHLYVCAFHGCDSCMVKKEDIRMKGTTFHALLTTSWIVHPVSNYSVTGGNDEPVVSNKCRPRVVFAPGCPPTVRDPG